MRDYLWVYILQGKLDEFFTWAEIQIRQFHRDEKHLLPLFKRDKRDTKEPETRPIPKWE
jgi:hypothetical protein